MSYQTKIIIAIMSGYMSGRILSGSQDFFDVPHFIAFGLFLTATVSGGLAIAQVERLLEKKDESKSKS